MYDNQNVSARSRTALRECFLLVNVALIFFTSGSVVLAQSPLPAVGVAPVELKDVSPASKFLGRVEAANAVDIRARVEGFIATRPFREGQAVREGDDLFVLEKTSYEAALSAARATLGGAQATLEDAERRVQRNQELRRTQAVSQVTLEDAQTARDTARASMLAAEANVRQAELNLSYTTIKAPITGRIGVAAFSVGSLVGPSSGALARVVQIDPIRVVFSVNDRTILDLREGVTNFDEMKVAGTFVPTLRLSNGRDYPAKGEIEFVGNEIDQATGTLPVRARFPNPDGVLVPGQFVTVTIRPSASQLHPVVPVGAVRLNREGRFVLLLDENGKVTERRIRTGAQLGQDWIVEDGLKGGERLIVQGVQSARPGAAVRVVPIAGADGR